MKRYYLHIMIQNHWTQEPPPPTLFISSQTEIVTSLHSAEGFWKMFVQQTAPKNACCVAEEWTKCNFFYITQVKRFYKKL